MVPRSGKGSFFASIVLNLSAVGAACSELIRILSVACMIFLEIFNHASHLRASFKAPLCGFYCFAGILGVSVA